MERRRLLGAAGIELPDELTAGQAAADDVLDAAIVAWSAARKERGETATLPADPPGTGRATGRNLVLADRSVPDGVQCAAFVALCWKRDGDLGGAQPS